MKFEKVMLIGGEIPRGLIDIFRTSRSKVLTVPDGKMAVSRAHREIFDAAVVVSTGEEMDVAETVFNLRDISSSMELIIVSDHRDTSGSAVPQETLVRFVPNARVMTTQELKRHFDLS